MPVTFVKQKEKQKKKLSLAVESASTLQEAADAFGDLKAELDPLKKQFNSIKKLADEAEKRLVGLAEEEGLSADGTKNVLGKKWSVQLGAKASKTDVTEMEKIQKFLESIEPGLFLLLAKVGLTELRQYLTPQQLEQVTETERSGRRTLKVEEVA